MTLYHFTDTARLPYILQSGALKPGRNKLGGFPDPDFIWATTQAVGDQTASGGARGYREGVTRLVRFTLRREHFRPWREIVGDFPQWTAPQIERLENAARGLSNPADWFCRVEPLPLSDVINIETRSWRSPWAPLESREVSHVVLWPGLAMEIAGRVYMSREHQAPGGALGYECRTMFAHAVQGGRSEARAAV